MATNPTPPAGGGLTAVEETRRRYGWNPREVAFRVLPLVLYPGVWVHRRKETVELLDDARLSRHTSVDFTLPDEALPDANDGSIFVPLTLLGKQPLRDFSVLDETGRILPVLNTRQNASISTEMLVLVAEGVLRGSRGRDVVLDRSLRLRIFDLVTATPEEGSRLAKSILDGSAEVDARWQLEALRANRWFQRLVGDLAEKFVLLVDLGFQQPASRRVLKYRYEQDLDLGTQTVAQRFGLKPWEVGVRAPIIGDCEAYHAELILPPELLGVSCWLFEGGSGADGRPRFDRAIDQLPKPGIPVGTRPHLMAHDEPRGTGGWLVVGLRPSPIGVVSAALGIAVLAAAILLGGVVLSLAGRHASGDVAAAVVVALPGVAAAYLTRPDEHALVERIVRGVRLVLLSVAAASIAAASALAADLSYPWRLGVWLAGASVALTAACILADVYQGPSRAERLPWTTTSTWPSILLS